MSRSARTEEENPILESSTSDRAARAAARERLFDLSLDLMAVGSFDGHLLEVNPAWTACLGWTAAELTGRPWLEIVHPDDHASTTRFAQALLAGEPVPFFENRYLHKDGTSRWLSWSALPVLESRQFFGVARDITGQRLQLERQRHNERLLRMAGATAQLGGWSLDLAAAEVAWSDEVCAIHEVPPGFRPGVDEGIGFYAPEGRAEIRRLLGACLEHGAPFTFEKEIVTARGNRRWVCAIGEAVRDAGGRIVRIEGAFQDVTDRHRAEAALRASEARFRTVIQSSWDVFHLVAADATILYESPAVTRVLGYAPEEMVGRNAFEFIHPDDAADVARTPDELPPAGGSQVKVLRVRHKDGGWRWVESYEVNLLDNPDVGAFAVNYRDITERKAAEDSLRESEASLKAAQRIAGLGNWSWDLRTGALRWSDEVCRLFGSSPDEFDGTYDAFLRGVHPDDRERADRAVRESVDTGRAYHVEHRTVAPDGTVRIVLGQGEVTRDGNGRPLRMDGTILDVTDRRMAEFHLAETNRALHLLSRCNEAVIRSEREDELLATVCRIAVEEGGFRMAWVGWPEEGESRAVVPRAHAGVEDGYLASAGITWSDASALGRGPVGRAIRDGQPVVIADLSADPSFLPWLEAARVRGYRGLIALPLRHAADILGVLVLYLAEVRVLQEQELRVLRDLADDVAFGLVTLRGREERLRLQTALEKMATSVSASTGAQFFEQLAVSMAEALGAGAAFVVRTADGDARVIAGCVDGRTVPPFPLALAGTPGERVLAEASCIVPVSVEDVFGGGAPRAPAWTRGYAGCRLDGASGRPVGLLFVLFPDRVRSPAFVASTLRIFAARAAAELGRQKAEARLQEQASLLDEAQDAILVRDLDHRILYWNRSAERRYGWTAAEAVGRSARDLLYDDPTASDVATAATLARGEWIGELRHLRKDGTPIPVEARLSLVRDDEGVPRSILSVNTDLTERKELEKAEDQLRQAQKMEAIGSLAGGIAHDFNNLLSVILSYTELMVGDLPPGDPLVSDLDEVKKAGLRAAELTRRLLAFSRKQLLEPVVLDLNQVVHGVTQMLGRLLGEDVELTVATGPGESRIFADSGQIGQVLMNLVVNARDAMPGGGSVTIETANVDLDASQVAEHVGARPGPYVTLAVSDTGHGMDRATRERIFEPFFTTKDKSKGTGLGLSTVYGIVQQSGGYVRVDSEPGAGTTFTVYLPRSDREVALPAAPPPQATSLRGTETILLVEDEEQVRTILRTILRRQGYVVREAQNGGEAFLICEQLPGRIHLMITDVVMPRLSGRQLAERLSVLRPDMKILYVSGYTGDAIEHHGVLDAGIEFLPKPIMPEALLRKVRAMLDGAGRG